MNGRKVSLFPYLTYTSVISVSQLITEHCDVVERDRRKVFSPLLVVICLFSISWRFISPVITPAISPFQGYSPQPFVKPFTEHLNLGRLHRSSNSDTNCQHGKHSAIALTHLAISQFLYYRPIEILVIFSVFPWPTSLNLGFKKVMRGNVFSVDEETDFRVQMGISKKTCISVT